MMAAFEEWFGIWAWSAAGITIGWFALFGGIGTMRSTKVAAWIRAKHAKAADRLDWVYGIVIALWTVACAYGWVIA